MQGSEVVEDMLKLAVGRGCVVCGLAQRFDAGVESGTVEAESAFQKGGDALCVMVFQSGMVVLLVVGAAGTQGGEVG